MRTFPCLALIGSFALASCSDDTNASPCAPGESQSCACVTGDLGAQVCREDGTGFEPCSCELPGGGGAGGGGNGPGAGGSGGFECAPGEEAACYDGPAGTENEGTCQGGTKTCLSTKLWGPCDGQVLPTTDLCISPEDEDCNNEPPDCPTQWQVALTGQANGDVGMRDMAIAPDDSIVVVGRFAEDLNLDGQIISSPATGDGLVFKLSPSGDVVWTRPLSGLSYAYVEGVAVAPDGTIVAVGYFAGEADFGVGGPVTAVGGQAGFVWALAADGTPLWVEVLDPGSPNGARLNAVAIDGAGNIFVSGYSVLGLSEFGGEEIPANFSVVIALSPTGTTQWFDTSLSTLLDNAQMTTDPSGRLLVISDNYSNGPFDFGDGPVALDGFVLRYELDGSRGDYFTYEAMMGSIDGTYSQSISTLPNGGFRIVHPSNATAIDFGGGAIGWTGSFVVDLDEDLAHVSSFGIGSGYTPQLVDHAVAPNGSMVLGGTFFGQNIDVAGMTFSADVAQAMLVRTDAAGSPVDAEVFGGEMAFARFFRLAFDSTGSLITMGYWGGEGTVDLGLGPLPQAPGGGGVFIARLD